MKIKLALIGKDIAHSKSQEIYERLLGPIVDYTLIDCGQQGDIPSLDVLASSYHGVSITAPYKKYFLDKVKNMNPEIPFINTLSFESKVKGINTDYLGVLHILKEYIKTDKISETVILGDGAMSLITQKACDVLGLPFIILSRRDKSLGSVDEVLSKSNGNTLVINSCAREYRFKAECDGFFFWDYNYGLAEHFEYFSSRNIPYQDGLSLLELQASFALSFWNFKTS